MEIVNSKGSVNEVGSVACGVACGLGCIVFGGYTTLVSLALELV